MEIVPLATEHAERVAALKGGCFGGEPSSVDIEAERRRGVTEAWVARDGERIVGFAFLQVVADEAELHTIGVDRARRRRGVGRALLERAVEAVRARGAACLFLEVARDNAAAIALYEALGFAVERVRERYYDSGADALVMKLDLSGRPAASLP